jgi:uncharacterized RDD family membrane protein YckC
MRPSAQTELKPATPFRRLIAFALDGLIAAVLWLGIMALFFGGPDDELNSTKNFLTSTALQASYSIIFISVYTATPGMMALGMRVTDREGGRVLPDAVILRYVVFFVGQLIIIGSIVSLVMLLFDDRRRTLHDRVAGTLVLAGRPSFGADEK